MKKPAIFRNMNVTAWYRMFWKLHEFSGKFCNRFLVLQHNYPFLTSIPVHIVNIVILTTVYGWYTIHGRQIHPIGTCSLLQWPLSEYKIWHSVFKTKSTPEIVMLMERMDKGHGDDLKDSFISLFGIQLKDAWKIKCIAMGNSTA